MAVNYYDQFQPLTYNPMTLQEMLIGPQMMQQKHDQYQALLDQEGLFDVPALEVDKPGVQQWMDKYKENINDLSDQLLRSGYNKDLSRRARQILQEKQQAISSRGYLGRANQAYQQYLKNVEDEKKRLEKGLPQEYLYVFKYPCKLKRRDADYSGITNDNVLIYIKINDRKIPYKKVFIISFHKNRIKVD